MNIKFDNMYINDNKMIRILLNKQSFIKIKTFLYYFQNIDTLKIEL